MTKLLENSIQWKIKGAAEVFYLPPEITATIRVLCFWLESSSVSNNSHMFHIKMKDNHVSLKDQTRFSCKNHALIPWLHNQARMDLLHPRDFPGAANIWPFPGWTPKYKETKATSQNNGVQMTSPRLPMQRTMIGELAPSLPAFWLCQPGVIWQPLFVTADLHQLGKRCWAIEKHLMRTTCFPSLLGCNLAQEKNKKVQQTAFMTIQAFWLLCVSCSKTCSDPCPLPALESLCHQCDWSHCQ